MKNEFVEGTKRIWLYKAATKITKPRSNKNCMLIPVGPGILGAAWLAGGRTACSAEAALFFLLGILLCGSSSGTQGTRDLDKNDRNTGSVHDLRSFRRFNISYPQRLTEVEA